MTQQRKIIASGLGPDFLSKRIPPHLYFVGAAIFHYLGPSFAVLLFARVPVSGVAWLRIVSAGLVFALWRRRWRTLAGRGDAGIAGRGDAGKKVTN